MSTPIIAAFALLLTTLVVVVVLLVNAKRAQRREQYSAEAERMRRVAQRMHEMLDQSRRIQDEMRANLNRMQNDMYTTFSIGVREEPAHRPAPRAPTQAPSPVTQRSGKTTPPRPRYSYLDEDESEP